MIVNTRFTSLQTIFFLLFSIPLYGGEVTPLLDLSLEELLKVKVSVASTKSETVIETPAIVSRYNRVDLERMGISNLREMFNFIPGVIVQDSLGGWGAVQIRGIDEAFNQKVLFLLDGVPYHQPSHSVIPMEGVPWESISHVEVIRGPGAVFYGSQASGGVLNVITKKSSGTNSASLKTGSNSLIEGGGYYNKKLSGSSNIYGAVEYRTEDGYTTTYNEYFADVGTITDDVKRYLKRKSALLRYNISDFVILLQAFSDTTKGLNDGYTDENTLQTIEMESAGQLIHVENSWNFDTSKVTLFADHNHYTFDFIIGNVFAPSVDALVTKDDNGKRDYRFRYGGNIVYDVSDSIEAVIGLEQETRSRGNYRMYFRDNPGEPLATVLENGKVDEFSAYSQLDYNVGNWRFLLGNRYTDNEISGQKNTPRAGIVYKFDEHQSLKALYSTGFNSPNPTQTSIYAPGNIIGNENLTAEVVKTYDLAYSYSKANVLFVANVYSLKAEDFIERSFSESLGAVTVLNEGTFKRKGAEIDFQVATKNSKLFLNLAYQSEGNKVIDNDPTAFNAPRIMASIGASTILKGGHSVGGDISYIGSRHNLDGYSIVNVNYSTRLSEFELFVVGRNLLNADILNPDNFSQNSVLVAQGEQGINVQLGVKYHF